MVNIKQVKALGTDQLLEVKEGKGVIGKPIASHPDKFSHRVSIGIKKAQYELYLHIPSFQVIIGFDVAAQTIHVVNIMVI